MRTSRAAAGGVTRLLHALLQGFRSGRGLGGGLFMGIGNLRVQTVESDLFFFLGFRFVSQMFFARPNCTRSLCGTRVRAGDLVACYPAPHTSEVGSGQMLIVGLLVL